MARTAKYDEEDTSVRTLKIKGNTRSYKISLCRDQGKMNTPVGSHVEIANVIVQVYNEEKSVFTTSRTKLMVRVTSFNNVQKFINFYSNLYCCFTEDRIDLCLHKFIFQTGLNLQKILHWYYKLCHTFQILCF